jgi:hypothetical protein
MLSWEQMHAATSTMVDVVVLFGALGAAIKLRLFGVLSHRWHTDVCCQHVVLPDGVVFVAEYYITNTGSRPLTISSVDIQLVGATRSGVLLLPDDARIIAQRRHEPDTGETGYRRLCEIQPGERSIFTLRASLDALDDIVFVHAGFRRGSAVAGDFTAMYVKPSSLTSPLKRQ